MKAHSKETGSNFWLQENGQERQLCVGEKIDFDNIDGERIGVEVAGIDHFEIARCAIDSSGNTIAMVNHSWQPASVPQTDGLNRHYFTAVVERLPKGIEFLPERKALVFPQAAIVYKAGA